MQQIEQGQELRLPAVKKPSVVPEPEMKPSEGMVITVTRFRFVGVTRIDESRLQKAVQPWLNRPVGFSELQKAAAAAAAVYRDAGWIVRAYLPKQEIEDGVVTIRIIEAVFGEVQIEGADKVRSRPGTVRKMVLSAQGSGEPLNGDSIDRALLVIDDLPGLTAQGFLKEGKNDGETDLVLQLEPEQLLSGDFGFDNTGSRSTGEYRLTESIYGNSLLGLGDLLSGNVIHSQGSDYVRAGWSFPVGYSGMRVGVNRSQLKYRVITAEFASLNLKGHSDSTGLDTSYPIVRSRSKNLYLTFNYDRKNYYNASNSVATSDYGINVGSIGLSGNMFDELGGGGSSSGGITLANGKVDLDGSPNRSADANGAHTEGNFRILRYALRRQQVITPKLSLLAAWTGQIASRNLDSSEKIYLGGVNGIRAYPVNEAGGSEGNIFNLEFRYALPLNFTLSAFYDLGRIRVNHDNNINGAALKNDQTLQGAGLGLAWIAPAGASVRAIWAHRIGTNPNANPTTGNDQDGTHELNRFWLQASLPF